jgi:hypothetical protein
MRVRGHCCDRDRMCMVAVGYDNRIVRVRCNNVCACRVAMCATCRYCQSVTMESCVTGVPIEVNTVYVRAARHRTALARVDVH